MSLLCSCCTIPCFSLGFRVPASFFHFILRSNVVSSTSVMFTYFVVHHAKILDRFSLSLTTKVDYL